MSTPTTRATLPCAILQNACALLGYQKGELEGKNVNILMPAPFAQHHNRYIRQYIQTGRDRVLNKVTPGVPALHKERYVLPVRLAVTKVSGSNEDPTFMGVLEVRPRGVPLAVAFVQSVLVISAEAVVALI